MVGSSNVELAITHALADPGFPVGSANLIKGSINSRRPCFHKLSVETKESGPLGCGNAGCTPMDLPMTLLNRHS